MANTDSFIDEVNEEVRRDQLYRLMRRWGWVPILLVIVIVGGAAYVEVQRAQGEAQAEAFGDALLEALERDDADLRVAGLDAIEAPNPEGQMIIALMAAAEQAGAEQAAEAAARLHQAAEAPDLSRRYVDLALLKAQMIDPAPEAEARMMLERLAEPGAPYAPLAQEQLALMEARAGNLDAALDILRSIERSAAATAGLQQRAGQLIVALESGATLRDTAPEPAAAPESDAGPEAESAAASETQGEAPPSETAGDDAAGSGEETAPGDDGDAETNTDAEAAEDEPETAPSE